MKQLTDPKYKFYFIGILIVFVATFVSRSIALQFFLPYYSIDENDIVEYAVVYLCGDWDPHWYIYGPLYSYVLAIIFFVFSLFSEGSLDEYIQDIFFNPTKFYLAARILNVIINVLLAILTYKLAYLVFSNRRRAVIAFFIAIFPFFDIITNFEPRVDTFLAFFVILSLIQLVLLYKTNRIRHYILLGLFTGFSLASKPLPALLILPTILLFIPLTELKQQRKLTYWKKDRIISANENFSVILMIKNVFRYLFNYKLLILISFIVIGNFITNPYSVISFNKYIETQEKAASEQGVRDFIQGWDITRFFDNIGIVFVVFGIISIIYWTYSSARKRKYESLLLIIYLFCFWFPFALGAARDYFYIPILPVIIISISYLVSEFSLKFNQKYRLFIIMAAGLVLFIQPYNRYIIKDLKLITVDPYSRHTLSAAYSYLENNIDPNNNFLVVGPTPRLPRIVFKDVDLYTKIERDGTRKDLLGDYFMYGRGNHPNWVKLFILAHRNEVAKNGFILENGDFFKGDIGLMSIYNKIKSGSFDYLITCYDYSDHAFLNKQLLVKFDKPEYLYGSAVYIYDLVKDFTLSEPKTSTDYLIVAKEARNRGDIDSADFHYSKAYEIDSTNTVVLFEIGTHEFYKKDYQLAYTYFDKGSRLNPTSFHMIYNKGLCMMITQKLHLSQTPFGKVITLFC